MDITRLLSFQVGWLVMLKLKKRRLRGVDSDVTCCNLSPRQRKMSFNGLTTYLRKQYSLGSPYIEPSKNLTSYAQPCNSVSKGYKKEPLKNQATGLNAGPGRPTFWIPTPGLKESSTDAFVDTMLKKLYMDVEDEQARALLMEYFTTLVIPHVTNISYASLTMEMHDFSGLTFRLKTKPDPKYLAGFKLEQVEHVLEYYGRQSGNWNLDIFTLDEMLSRRSLIFILNFSLQELDLYNIFQLDRGLLLNYAGLLDANYLNNPYHNQIHAADVTHSIFFLLKTKILEELTTPLEKLALLIAAASHDVGHPGVNSQFLINTSHPLAITYNDVSVLENYHAASAFTLMENKVANFLTALSAEDRKDFRRIVIKTILSTDLAVHASLIQSFKQANDDLMCCRTDVSQTLKEVVFCSLVHCADLANPTKSLHIYREWSNRVMREFVQQGKRESALGLPTSICGERNSLIIEKVQTKFVDIFVEPIWTILCQMVAPEMDFVIFQLKKNRAFYATQLEDNEY